MVNLYALGWIELYEYNVICRNIEEKGQLLSFGFVATNLSLL